MASRCFITPDQAIAQLEYHAGHADEEREVPAFVGMLRPYRGLRQESFNDVMQCIHALAFRLRDAEQLPRSLVASLWAIAWYPRCWGISPDGMLRRNNLISAEDLAQLERWVNQIESCVGLLLDGADDAAAFDYP